MNNLVALFARVAPDYDANFMLTHLNKKFASVDELQRSSMIEEFLKFMYLRSLHGRGFIPLIGDVDDIWHEFILQTMEYEKFCQALPGKKFIHHNSVHLEEFADGKDRREVVADLLRWLPDYYQHFGEFTESAAPYWMMVGFLRTEMNLSLPEINALANQTA